MNTNKKVQLLVRNYLNEVFMKKSRGNYIQYIEKIKGRYYKGDLYPENAFKDNDDILAGWGDITNIEPTKKYSEIYIAYNENIVYINIYILDKLYIRDKIYFKNN